MCASYGLQVLPDDLRDAFDTLDEKESTAALTEWMATFSADPVKPTGAKMRNLNPIVREREREGERRRTLDLAWWKLWVGGKPAEFPAINARVEKLLGGAWGGPARSRRALVPVTEYFEKGHAFRLPEGDPAVSGPHGLAALAGIWNVNRTTDPDGTERWMVSYAIVTRPAHAHVAGIHDRMPLIVAPELYDEWLDPTRTADPGLLDEVVAASDGPASRLEILAR
ncbi:MAG: SOS response-associated peptidase family protein [Actinomycetales bacterium]|nr:SOS response-associated peptidase family protein [Actinomycetales bacterium]